MDLLERFGVTEPVERLSNDHGRSVAIIEGHRFRSPVERARTRKRFRQPPPHPFNRLDGNNVEAPRDQRARHLPCTGSEIDDQTVRVKVIDQPVDRCIWIAGPGALVHVGGSVEPDRRRPVNVFQRSTQETCLSSVNSSMP